MKKINKVSLIGLGSLGILYAEHLSKVIPREDLLIIADEHRINRYTSEGIYCNGERCQFNYISPELVVEPADLIIIAVKYTQLPQAIKAIKHHVGEETIILSVLNGIQSEIDIAKVYGQKHLLYCVAQGMTASKVGNQMSYKHKGVLCFGELDETENSVKVGRLKTFFDTLKMPYEINNQMAVKLWSKLMANVGINQTVAFYEKTNHIVQVPGEARDMMIGAMEEVHQIARLEGVPLDHGQVDYWLTIIDGLNPMGMPSMAQDVKARRYSEIELFAGTIVRLAKKHQVEVPINEGFYNHFIALEATYV